MLAFARSVLAHATAALALALGAAALMGGLYFALFALAIVIGGDLGGPLALPGMVLIGFVAAAVAALAVYLPATLIAHALRRATGWPWIAEIPVATLAAAAICLGGGAAIGWANDRLLDGLFGGSVVLVLSFVPLGIYWWTVQGLDLVGRGLTALVRGCVGTLGRLVRSSKRARLAE